MIGDKGLLWFDDTDSELAEKVNWACDAFRHKPEYRGKKIARVLVHPSAMESVGDAKSASFDGVLVMPDTSILVSHFFVVEEKEDDGD